MVLRMRGRYRRCMPVPYPFNYIEVSYPVYVVYKIYGTSILCTGIDSIHGSISMVLATLTAVVSTWGILGAIFVFTCVISVNCL